MIWPPGAGGMTEEDFEHSMLLLSRQRPDAVQKLHGWNNGISDSTMRCPSLFNESAIKHANQHNGAHGKFHFAPIEYTPSLMQGFVSFQANFIH